MAPARECRTHSSSSTTLSISQSPERQGALDIVISSSPTFKRRKDFKEAARKRSQEKIRQKKLSLAKMSSDCDVYSETSHEFKEEKMMSEETVCMSENDQTVSIEISGDNNHDNALESEEANVPSSTGMSGVVGTVGSAAESDMAASLSLDLQPSTGGGGSGSGEGSSGFWTSVISSPTQEYSQSPTESVRKYHYIIQNKSNNESFIIHCLSCQFFIDE